jgi:hypothetical protein
LHSHSANPFAGTSGGEIHAFRNPEKQTTIFYRHQERLAIRPFGFHWPEALIPRRCGWNAINARLFA